MTCFRQALPEIERQSCIPMDSTGTRHDNSNAALMVANQADLLKDLERLNDLMTLARNILGTTVAQTLAAMEKFDQQVLKFIDLCVRVTSRCYDGSASPKVETQWTSIITACKSSNSSSRLIHCYRFFSLPAPASCPPSNTFDSQKVVGHLSPVSSQSDIPQRTPQTSSLARSFRKLKVFTPRSGVHKGQH